MNFASVIRVLCYVALGLAALMSLPILAAWAYSETPQLITFSFLLILLTLIAGSVLLLTPKASRPARPPDGLAAAIFGWVLAGLITAPPFVLGVANTSVLAAIHEAVSCLTTTGHSVVSIGEGGWPVSLLVWRGVLHIIGAIFTLTIAASVFAALNLGGPGIHRTELFTIPDDSFFNAVPRVLVAATLFVVILISALVILLVFVGTPGDQAVMDAISAITTGLVDPNQSTTYFSPLRNVLVSLGLIIGILGLHFGLQVRRGRFLDSINDPEFFAFLTALAIFSGLAMMAGLSVWQSAAWGLSALSTSGMPVSSGEPGSNLPVSMLILPALLGGSALSAAGGIKLGRLVILVRRAAQEFGSLGYRGSMIKFQYRRRTLEESSVIGVWVYLIGYVSAIVLFICILSFFGHDFDDSVLTAIGAVSNSGMLVQPEIATNNIHGPLIIAMLLGRWEVLALIPVFFPSFWRR